MSIRQDNIRRRSFSYKMKCWLRSNHTKEVKKVIFFLCGFTLSILWLGWIFFIPHFFH